MEIAGAYLDSGSAAQPAFPALPSGTDQAKAMSSYFEAYRALRSVDDEPAKPVASSGSDGASGQAKEKPLKPAQERDYYISINLMQSWFEDGLVTALLDADANLYEKLESLYSRALVRLDDEPSTALLSPLLLSSWSATVKKYYNLDRIVYFSLMDTKAPASRHVKVPDDCALARYFPFVSFEPDSLQVSVVNVTSGDYEFKRDFPLE
jgi:hypothetical protein